MTIRPVIASIVEGYGEVYAVPELIRRVAGEKCGRYDIDVPTPFRVPRNRMLRDGEISRAIRLQAARVTGPGGIIVIADSDDDCPLQLAKALSPDSRDVPVLAAIAVREFEAWYLAAVDSLTHHRAIRAEAGPPTDPEARRDAKGQLEQRMTESYRETLHQVAFASMLDLDLAAARAPSFARFVRCVQRLLR